MVGLGLNDVEMRDNPDLDGYVVHNVNNNPILPFENETFDAVAITVSAQYLTKPIDTFHQVNRILRPAGVFIVSFSNRMFPTKAVLNWRNSTDRAGSIWSAPTWRKPRISRTSRLLSSTLRPARPTTRCLS
jgi:SAM-dependent methyltransferase